METKIEGVAEALALLDPNAKTFPKVLDNTMVSGFRSCEKKHYWRQLAYLQRGEGSIHLISGGAFARGLEITRKRYFDDSLDFETALIHGAAALIAAYGNVEPHPKYTAKSVFNMVGALVFYFETWPINRIILPYRPNESARHTIEWNFAIPLPEVKHPDTNEPILYCGRFDFIGRHEHFPALFGEDDKTTSQLGESWFNRWRLSSQILGYSWGARESGIKLGGFNVRGVSLLKNSYGQGEAMLMINDWQIDRWLENTLITVRQMIRAYETKTWRMDMGNSCSQFGGCDYLPLCEAIDPTPWIPVNFVRHEWNPLASRD